MIQRLSYTIVVVLLAVIQLMAQGEMRTGRDIGGSKMGNPSLKDAKEEKKSIPSVIRNWQLTDHGAIIKPSVLDTTLNFYHDYLPFNKVSFSNTFTGTLGGAYISNDFFKRVNQADFYFSRSFDAYTVSPDKIQYFNTSTPYSVLDYSQSENRETRNETRFNVFFTQNINPKTNFAFFYNQARSKGYYDDDDNDNKYHSIGLFGSYQSDHLTIHSNIIFNRLNTEEDGGVEENQDLFSESVNLKMNDATSQLNNSTAFFNGEYRLGKTINEGDTINSFIPRTGFIYEVELSNNQRVFKKTDAKDGFFKDVYLNSETTNDQTIYTRLTNLFQIKFYEAPDRKYTFGKRVYIGNDQLWYRYPLMNNNSEEMVFEIGNNYSFENGRFIIQGYAWDIIPSVQFSYDRKQSNNFVGGAIYRSEGKFWQWNASGKLYFAGYKAGQTEIEGYINKPLLIANDTTSLKVEGSLKTLIPDYFEQNYFSNHFKWRNNFGNTNEMILKGTIHSQKFKTTLGANYALIDNYIYNNKNALPTQASGELLVLSAYLNKDFEGKHWLVRSQVLWQKSSESDYLQLPDLAAYLSLNVKTTLSKVLHIVAGVDARYNTEFYADAFEPSTGRFYQQNDVKIGNYPFIDLHVNLKLKRTRAFFNFMNVTPWFLDNSNFWSAPSYPLFKTTYRIGIAWSFYN